MKPRNVGDAAKSTKNSRVVDERGIPKDLTKLMVTFLSTLVGHMKVKILGGFVIPYIKKQHSPHVRERSDFIIDFFQLRLVICCVSLRKLDHSLKSIQRISD